MNEQIVNKIVITKEEIREMLIDFICGQFLFDKEDIVIDKSLIDTGIVDSVGLIEIASFIEFKFNFKIVEEQLNRQNFGSVLLIVDFIYKNKK